MFPVLLSPLVILLFVGVCNSIDPGWEESFYTWVGSVAVCPMIYQLIVIVAIVTGPLSSPVFDATRPMRCDHLVAVRMRLHAGAWINTQMAMDIDDAGRNPFAVGLDDGGAPWCPQLLAYCRNLAVTALETAGGN